MKELKTRRLILRPFQESDYDDLYTFLKQLEEDEFEGYPGITYENGKEHLKYRVGSEEFYAVELAGSGKVIGNIYCGNRDFEAREVGYIINKDHRRNGYAQEALKAVMEKAFQEGAHRIYAECDPGNVRSWKLLEKLGMKREAHLRQNIYFRKNDAGAPVWKDTYVYAVTADERYEKQVCIAERELTADVLDVLIRLSEDWEAEGSCHGYRKNEKADIEGNRIFLAEDDGETVGYLFGHREATKKETSIMPEGTPYFEVEELYVKPEYRNRGIGKKLFAYAEETVSAEVPYMMLGTATKNWKAILHFYLDELDMSFWSARLFKRIQA